MQREILEGNPDADLRVYAVWIRMMAADQRSRISPFVLADPRVRHYWDGDRVIGQWFGDEVEESGRVAWDTYLLYGPEAAWAALPQPLVGRGGTVIGDSETLAQLLGPFLEAN